MLGKESLYGAVLSYVNYHGHSKVSTKHPWWTNEMDRISRLSNLKKVSVTVTAKSGKKKIWLVSPE